MLDRVAVFLAALWWGGTTAVAFLVVPWLFARLGPAVAGPLAGGLFSYLAWSTALLAGAVFFVLRIQTAKPPPSAPADIARNAATQAVVLTAILLALVQEFGVAHRILNARTSGGNLPLWHAVGSGLVLLQWLCAGTTLWRTTLRLVQRTT